MRPRMADWTVSAHLRKGITRAVVHHIIAEAKRRGYRRLSLETGSDGRVRAGAPPLCFVRFQLLRAISVITGTIRTASL